MHLHHAVVLDIGCGDGLRTHALAAASERVIAVDPDVKVLDHAQQAHAADNVEYVHANALQLPFPSAAFDLTIFTMSFHHLSKEQMPAAIKESLRVTKPQGYIAFLEPDFSGSLYEADREFGTGDGDIRDVKAFAYHTMLSATGMSEVDEFVDGYTYTFKTVEEYSTEEQPQHGTRADWQAFLADHNFRLEADERLSIFQKQ